MAMQDIKNYADANWNQYLESITELSKEQKTGTALVISDMQMYNFDKITKEIYIKRSNGVPTSADAFAFSKKHIQFVEFKSGFKKKITKNTMDKEKAKCEAANGIICEQFWNLFFKNQETETAGLIHSLQMKAADSYITLEKQILPKCQGNSDRILVDLWVIIDEDEIDYMEDTLADLAGKPTPKNNIFKRVEKALSRFLKQQDANGNQYYYESIHVQSARDYENYLKTLQR